MAWIFHARVRAQMNATPPEANSEYSRGPERSERDSPLRFSASRRRGAASSQGSGASATRGFSGAILAGGLLGALLLLVAEFTPLFDISTGAGGSPVKSVGTGSHHAYAMVPIALLAAALAYGVWRVGSRPALLSIGLLAVISLLISLLGDLPDAHTSGLITGSGGHYVTASSNPSAGLYLETLGGVVLLITCVCGFLLLGPPPRPARRAGVSAS
ncbi:MAG: hypothetical protein QOD66_1630 [Solirubrobacteraceae bacterium]|jgi:hypothetical protein|nr:hypothetical protein [Solirubrobacteraceae bacterium]